MNKLALTALVVVCLTTMQGATAAPDRQVVVTPLSQEAISAHSGLRFACPVGSCEVGNLNPVHYSLTDWVWGPEKYKYMFFADAGQCEDCLEGFTLEAVSLVLQFGPEDVPVTFEARVDFGEGDRNDVLACTYPDRDICVSPVHTVAIDSAGLYQIRLPLDIDCECAKFGYWYGIGFEFLTPFESGREPDMITDATPVGCTSWNDYAGAGWLDLDDHGFPGEINLSAEAVCCSNPVTTDRSTWSEIKAMYR